MIWETDRLWRKKLYSSDSNCLLCYLCGAQDLSNFPRNKLFKVFSRVDLRYFNPFMDLNLHNSLSTLAKILKEWYLI